MPQAQKITQPSPAGPIEVNAFVVADGGLAYVVTATKLPLDAMGKAPEATLSGVVGGTVTSTGGTVVSQKEARLGKAPGKEFEFTMKGGKYGWSRAYMANGRIYQLMIAGPKDQVTGPAGAAFLDSFALLTP
jgi:hypothetical protein